MDLLYKRYASPMSFLDIMLHTGRFREFINELLSIYRDEQDDDVLFDIWLHKVWDNTPYAVWKSSLTSTESKPASKADLEATLNESKGILEGFKPSKR